MGDPLSVTCVGTLWQKEWKGLWVHRPALYQTEGHSVDFQLCSGAGVTLNSGKG